ncbi:hypothetical protein Tco_1239217, partial [Tanacetum coccineum]
YMGMEVDESLAFDLLSYHEAYQGEFVVMFETYMLHRVPKVMSSDRDGSPKIGGVGPGCFDEARTFDSHAASFTTIGTPYLRCGSQQSGELGSSIVTWNGDRSGTGSRFAIS